MKKLIHNFFDKIGLQLSIKKNLWYQNAFDVQQRIFGNRKNDKLVIFDVGASVGPIVRKYKELFPQSHIHAFEPLPDFFEQLIEYTKPLSADVSYNNYGLYSSIGNVTFYNTESEVSSSILPPNNSGTWVDNHIVESKKLTIKTNTLDNYCAENNLDHIDILKMDIQGSELEVLKGAENLLMKKKIELIYCEIWFIQSYKNQPMFGEIAAYLEKFGYRIFGLYNTHYDMSLNGKCLWGDAIFVK